MELNKDVLFLIFEELKNDKRSLYSCLLVNRTWCATAVPILWRNPGQFSLTSNSKDVLFNIILLHLSEESRDILKNKGINNLINNKYQYPLFNYINFWKYLDLSFVLNICSQSKFIRDEVLKLFINRNRNFIHLSVAQIFDFQMYHILWDECYFPELESFHCDNSIDQNVLREMAKTCKSIKKLRYDRIHFSYSDNSGIIKLIEVQKNLSDVKFGYKKKMDDKLSNKSLEESLIKHANTIKYLRIEWNPVTRFLSYFVNLLSLEIDISYLEREESFYLNNLSLPILKILKINYISSRILANLIENTLGCLYKISVNLDVDGGRKLIQAIYQNCKNLKYLKLKFFICNYSLISEIENLLNNCQLLSELIIDNFDIFDSFRWDRLFKTLIRSSPIGLFKFKFSSNRMIRLEHLKLLFDSWKDKRSMFLKISSSNWMDKSRLEDLIEEYKAEGIIERYIISNRHNCEDDFGWI